MEVTLRKYQLSDVDDFMGWACDSEVLRFSRLKLWVHQDSSKEDILSYFRQVVIPHPWYRAICLDSHPIGFICIEPAGSGDHNRGRAISGAIDRNYWGQGIMEFAIRRAVYDAFKEMPHLNRIEAFANSKNNASQRVLEKAGFHKEGILRNYYNFNGEIVDRITYILLPKDLINAKL